MTANIYIVDKTKEFIKEVNVRLDIRQKLILGNLILLLIQLLWWTKW